MPGRDEEDHQDDQKPLYMLMPQQFLVQNNFLARKYSEKKYKWKKNPSEGGKTEVV
jgi:hypothetical protein